MRTRLAYCLFAGASVLLTVGCPQFERDFVISSDAGGLPLSDSGTEGSSLDASDAATAAAEAASDATTEPDIATSDVAVQEAGPVPDASPCSAGSLQCSSLQPQLCENGEWHNVGAACVSQACVAGACMGVCSPGATQCAGLSYAPEAGAFVGDYTTTQTCSPMGQWGPEVSCSQPTPTCKNGSCYCAYTICGGMCVNEDDDNNNCGACGVACTGDDSCQAAGVVTGDAGLLTGFVGKCAPL